MALSLPWSMTAAAQGSTSPTGTAADISDVLMWLVWLLLPIVGGGVGLGLIWRWARRFAVDPTAAEVARGKFSIAQLRDFRDRSLITQQEYERARTVIMARELNEKQSQRTPTDQPDDRDDPDDSDKRDDSDKSDG